MISCCLQEDRTLRFLPLCLILALAVGPVPASGEGIPAGSRANPVHADPPRESLFAEGGRLDRSHAFLDRKFNAAVGWFDGLFGYPAGPDPEMTGNGLKWTNDLRVDEDEGFHYKPSLRARIRLPIFRKRMHLVILEESRDEAIAPVPVDPGTPVVNTPTRSNSLRAVNTELRYYARDSKAGYAFLAAGSRFAWPPETFVRTRFLRRFLLEDNTVTSPSITLFWQDHIGFGATPQLDVGHPFGREHFLLWTNSATFYGKVPGFLWGAEVSLARILSPSSAVALSLGANGSSRPNETEPRFGLGTNRYRAAVKYRRTFHRPWLFLELVPETVWRRDGDGGREFSPAFTARVEVNSAGTRALLPAPLIVRKPLPVPVPEHERY